MIENNGLQRNIDNNLVSPIIENEQSHLKDAISEIFIDAFNGCSMLFLSFLIFGVGIGVGVLIIINNSGGNKCIQRGVDDECYQFDYQDSKPGLIFLGALLIIIAIISTVFICKGTFTNEVNEARVCTLFGKYYGTVKKTGFLWINPFCTKRSVSLKSQNLNGAVIKVNDKYGNPVMMGCVVVWKINDTAKAIFEVEGTYNFINIQSECAVREIGCLFPYDKLHNEDTITLKGDQKEVNRVLVDLLSRRCAIAGIDIVEARITELSYAKEIAEVMLKTQAADAVIAARDKIVNGAVSIIGHALNSLDTNEICKMSREKKAKLVSNMLVILCGESQNVGNSGASATRLAEGFNKYS